MNLLREDAKQLSGAMVNMLGACYNECNVVIAPPYTAFEVVRTCIEDSNIELAAQNVFSSTSGAFTGEVSPPMLLDAGCRWVILGHSERRYILGENDEQIRQKLLLSVSSGLKVILCVGETGKQREDAVSDSEDAASRKELLFSPIKAQIESALGSIGEQLIADIVIAYEPVWAIGTGENATSFEIAEIHRCIRELLTRMFPACGNEVKILYGGSVKTVNIAGIMSADEVNGVLVGGESLSAGSFVKIIKSVGG